MFFKSPAPNPLVPLSIDKSKNERCGYSLNEKDEFPEVNYENSRRRMSNLNLPELSEPEVIRHYTNLSYLNYNIDAGFYPLGSCTMKYNPRINELTSSFFGFLNLHPLTPVEHAQGALELMYRLENLLAEISGLSRVSLQPAAGAQGEYTGIRMIQAYHQKNNNNFTKVLIPDSAHGTNPATAAMCGYEIEPIKTNENGLLDVEKIKSLVAKNNVAAIMITNPSTLGLFEKDIKLVCDIIHEKNGFVYCDGANLNAMLGITRPGDAGVDVMHFNLHKTFTTPHGGGGPGCGGVAVSNKLIPFLPTPTLEKSSKNANLFKFNFDLENSIGKVKDFYGHFLMMVRAYTYIRELGPTGIRNVGENAVLLANYIKNRLSPYYKLAYEQNCMHEVVFSDEYQKEFGVSTINIAKRLIDYGFHPPTIYFPLLVNGAIMIEPTETESLETVESFCQAMIKISEEAKAKDGFEKYFKNAPINAPTSKVNETMAARLPILNWQKRA